MNNEINIENKEIWQSIPNYEGYYEASNLGKIRSLDREILSKRIGWSNLNVKGKVLKPRNDKDGYETVVLCKDTIKKYARVHILIAETFIPNPNNLPQVNHSNNIRNDNNVNNLEWGTVQSNNFHRHKTWNHVISNTNPSGRNMSIAMSLAKATKLNPENVKKIRELYNTGKYTQQQIGDIFGLKKKHIGAVVTRRIWKLVD